MSVRLGAVVFVWIACFSAPWVQAQLAPRSAPRPGPKPPTARPRGSQAAPTVPIRGPASAVRPPAANVAAPPGHPAGPAAPGAPPPPPFQLSPQEQANLDRLLDDWQTKNANIKTLRCKFKRWEYDRVTNTAKYSTGELKYKTPDNALYRVEDPDGKQPWTDYWVCTGLAIFEFNYPQKELIERQLPPELQGKAIEDGPLPFLFSTDAEKLKRRYYLRLIPPPTDKPHEVWIEAYPRYRQDAANFARAELILDAAHDLLPNALQVHMPNGQERTVHQFEEIVVNSLWEKLRDDFSAPRAPRGWTRRVEQAQRIASEDPPAAAPRVSTRPAAGRPAQ